jgi:hypothetical protein
MFSSRRHYGVIQSKFNLYYDYKKIMLLQISLLGLFVTYEIEVLHRVCIISIYLSQPDVENLAEGSVCKKLKLSP